MTVELDFLGLLHQESAIGLDGDLNIIVQVHYGLVLSLWSGSEGAISARSHRERGEQQPYGYSRQSYAQMGCCQQLSESHGISLSLSRPLTTRG